MIGLRHLVAVFFDNVLWDLSLVGGVNNHGGLDANCVFNLDVLVHGLVQTLFRFHFVE